MDKELQIINDFAAVNEDAMKNVDEILKNDAG